MRSAHRERPSSILQELGKRIGGGLRSGFARAGGVRGDRGALGMQRRPHSFAVGKHTALVKRVQEQHWGGDPHAGQPREVYRPVQRVLEPVRDAERGPARVVAQMHKHVDIRVRTVVTARD